VSARGFSGGKRAEIGIVAQASNFYTPSSLPETHVKVTATTRVHAGEIVGLSMRALKPGVDLHYSPGSRACAIGEIYYLGMPRLFPQTYDRNKGRGKTPNTTVGHVGICAFPGVTPPSSTSIIRLSPYWCALGDSQKPMRKRPTLH
jgi:hypothetical protein